MGKSSCIDNYKTSYMYQDMYSYVNMWEGAALTEDGAEH